jgi:hypothetical protein
VILPGHGLIPADYYWKVHKKTKVRLFERAEAHGHLFLKLSEK